MIDSQSAVQLAIYTALDAATSVTNLADVWQNPPENTQPTATKGLVIIGLVDLTNEGGKGDDLDRATVSVFTQIRGSDTAKLFELNAAIRTVLEEQGVTSTGAQISQPVFVSASPKLMADGQTYEDELKFEMFVQAA